MLLNLLLASVLADLSPNWLGGGLPPVDLKFWQPMAVLAASVTGAGVECWGGWVLSIGVRFGAKFGVIFSRDFGPMKDFSEGSL